ncbi:MAG: hypothetical protein FWH27_19420 [Planctomycetaceae bacterium]|nr:hypothetical protein [Planctomycetaceae bacterium]
MATVSTVFFPEEMGGGDVVFGVATVLGLGEDFAFFVTITGATVLFFVSVIFFFAWVKDNLADDVFFDGVAFLAAVLTATGVFFPVAVFAVALTFAAALALAIFLSAEINSALRMSCQPRIPVFLAISASCLTVRVSSWPGIITWVISMILFCWIKCFNPPWQNQISHYLSYINYFLKSISVFHFVYFLQSIILYFCLG